MLNNATKKEKGQANVLMYWKKATKGFFVRPDDNLRRSQEDECACTSITIKKEASEEHTGDSPAQKSSCARAVVLFCSYTMSGVTRDDNGVVRAYTEVCRMVRDHVEFAILRQEYGWRRLWRWTKSALPYWAGATELRKMWYVALLHATAFCIQ